MKKAILAISILFFFVSSCSNGSSVVYTYQPPEDIGDGLAVGTLDEVKIDSTSLGRAVDNIRAGEYGEVHSLLIFRDGKLVFEEYFPGHVWQWDRPNYHGPWVHWDQDSRHNIMSAGKSITSACIGIGIEEGFIESVDQSIFDYLPEHQHWATDGKDQITIEHLLTMTSGLEWDEWGASYSDINNDMLRMWVDCDDQVACVLEMPLISEPGTDFTYTGGGMIVLGEIIKNATGMDIEAFANEYLFAPLGIDPVEWRRFDSGVIYAGGEQRLSSRDMLKFGVVFLNHGIWDGQQIVSEGWVEQSATPYPGPDNSWLNNFLRPIPPGDNTYGPRGYSYTWWTHEFSHDGNRFPAFWAFGWGGQKIVVFPDQDTVVVFTGGNYTSADATAEILTEYVIPAFE